MYCNSVATVYSFKDLCLHVKDVHRNNLQASNCAEDFHLNKENPREVKGNSYKYSKKATVKRVKNNFLPPH